MKRFSARFILAAVVLFLGTGCQLDFDLNSKSGREGLLEQVSRLITKGDCAGAVALIKPLYDSANTDNRVRLMMASAYGCFAKVNVFKVASEMALNSSEIAGTGFWNLITRLYYPSNLGDSQLEGAVLGVDAVLSVLRTGILVNPAYAVDSGSVNPKSLLPSDREGDANLYMAFIAMAGVGGTQARFGNPDPTTGAKGNDLPWETAATMTQDGCNYASSMIQMVEGMDAVIPLLDGAIQDSLTSVVDAFKDQIYDACNIGCQNIDPPGGWVPSGCTVVTPCETCPIALRNRLTCTPQTTNQSSCAAAGVINFINHSPLGWQP